MKINLMLIGAAVALTACSSVTPITTTGPNTYMVSSNAHGGFTSDTEVQGKVAQIT